MKETTKPVAICRAGHRAGSGVCDARVCDELTLNGVVGVDIKATNDAAELDDLHLVVDPDLAAAVNDEVPVGELVYNDRCHAGTEGASLLVVC